MEALYYVKTSPIKNEGNQWNSTLVEIFTGDSKIGEYTRNYTSYGEATFCPFQRDGKWYALYSKDYTVTSVMELPSCKHIGSCDSQFCPVEMYVPAFEDIFEPEDIDENDEIDEEYEAQATNIKKRIGRFAFVAGCHWGDDSSWKICYVDLTDLTKPVVSYKFGYIEKASNITLKDSIMFPMYFGSEGDISHIFITNSLRLNIDKEYFIADPIELSSQSEEVDFDDILKKMNKDDLIKHINSLNKTIKSNNRALALSHNFKVHVRREYGDAKVTELEVKAHY